MKELEQTYLLFFIGAEKTPAYILHKPEDKDKDAVLLVEFVIVKAYYDEELELYVYSGQSMNLKTF